MNPKKYFLIIIKNILDKVQMITQGFMHPTKEEPSFKIIVFAVSIRKDQSGWRNSPKVSTRINQFCPREVPINLDMNGHQKECSILKIALTS